MREKNNKIFKIIFLLLCSFFVNYHCLSQYTSYRIHPSDTVDQYEPVITVSPVNPLIMFCSANTYHPQGTILSSEGIYVTTDGGNTWTGTDICNGPPVQNNSGDPGIAIDKNGIFLIRNWGTFPSGLFTHYSTNLGQNWSSAYTIYSLAPPEDKGTLITDNLPSSPFYGRSYITGVNYQSPYPVFFAYTTNSGLNWSTYTAINGSPSNRCSGGELAVGPGGILYNVWAADSGNNIPSPEIYAGFGKSTNGGVSWNINQNVFTMHGIGGYLPQKGNIVVNGIPKIGVDNSGGPHNGWIYVISNEINHAPAGTDPDIVFHRSTDAGTTWSTGIRVNQDALNNGKIQFITGMCIDSSGGINVVYYDDRNTTSDSAQVFLSRSIDGGTTWSDYLISDRTFKPKQILTFKMGDFIGVASSQGKLFPVWMADYTGPGIFQVWSTKINIPIGIQKIGSRVPEDFDLKQNYPNPFNPSTTIEFSVPKKDNIKIIVYDALGKEVNTIVNQQVEPGSYKVNFESTNLASGIYYYSLVTSSFSTTKKMVLVK